MKQLYLIIVSSIFLSLQLIAQEEYRVGAPPPSTPINIVGDKIFSFRQSQLIITDLTTLEDEKVFIQTSEGHAVGIASSLHRDGAVFFYKDDNNVKAAYVDSEGEILMTRHYDIPAHPVSVHSTADGNIMVLFKLHEMCFEDHGQNKYYATIFTGDYLHKLTTYSICDELLTFCKAEIVDGKYTVFAKSRSLPTVNVYSWKPYTNEIECQDFEVDFYITDVLVEEDEWLISGVAQSDFTDKEVPIIAHVDSDMNVYNKIKFEQLGLAIEHELTSCYLSQGPYNTYWLSTNDFDNGDSFYVIHGVSNTARFSQLNHELAVLQTFAYDRNGAAKVLCVDSDCFFTFWGWHCGLPYFKHLNIGDASLFNNINNEEAITNEATPYPQIIVYPNPVSEQTQLTMPAGKNIKQLSLYTPKGRIVKLDPATTNLLLKNFAPGIYSLKAEDTEGNIYVKKLVKL